MIVEPSRDEVRRFGGGNAPGGISRRRPTAPPLWSPPSFANLQFWTTVEATSSITKSGSTVITWTDQSANGFVADSTFTGQGAPLFAAGAGPNGKDTIKLGTGGWGAGILGVPSAPILNPASQVTLIVIAKQLGSAPFGMFLAKTGSYFDSYMLGANGSGNVYGFINSYLSGSNSYNQPLNTWGMHVYRYDGVNQSFWHDGVKLTDVATSGAITTTSQPLKLGGYAGGGYANIESTEFAMYDTGISDGDIALWHAHSQSSYLTP